ncbi:3'-5' exonuclease [Salmonella enterica]|uniref:3'-5' exonuclease n=1 Tax=Salmonella enterica TaxID=28901 RepID=A0A5T4T532_SALER|nr:3'-5' exonuclease [Salmonella enterica]EBV3720596.1 3'-5' exonuclease [Salmonella enterica subsp. enterica serovar Oranienburg]EBL8560785.1 3'-5' exonuclease [Salmonella enterica]EBY7704274.1 3'-5' exonuclease [Salmonella enterica subsp. enterica serovar Oranienburg]ECY5283053.1 3'-5' exonuclease [Salmonella enterica subsp. enterica serovar Oranienburg]
MTKIVGGIDIESTGLDYSSGHKIIEIAITRYDLDTHTHIDSLEMRFNPRRSIDPKAQAVHGISLEKLVAEPLLADHAKDVAAYMAQCQIWVAHNGEAFDIPFIRHEFASYGVKLPSVPVVDTMLDGLWATEDGKRPRLEELAFSLGFIYDLEKAHGALYDTDLMMQCFFKAREKYGFFKLPFESA